MTSMESEAEVLKLDVRGRVRVAKERREALLDEFEQSGMSEAAFARMAGLKYVTFAQWAAKRRKERGLSVKRQVVSVEAEVEGKRQAERLYSEV